MVVRVNRFRKACTCVEAEGIVWRQGRWWLGQTVSVKSHAVDQRVEHVWQVIEVVLGTVVTYVQRSEQLEIGELYSTRKVDKLVRVARLLRYVKVDHVEQRALLSVVGAPVDIIAWTEDGITLNLLPPDKLRVGTVNKVHTGNFLLYL